MNYKKPAFWVAGISILIVAAAIVVLVTNHEPGPSVVVGEYDRTLSGDFYTSGNPAYAIGANAYGMPIFEDTDAAFEAIQADYADGFSAIMNEFTLESVNKKNYSWYKMYGAQLTTGDEDIQNQGVQISKFFDIYENSFNK